MQRLHRGWPSESFSFQAPHRQPGLLIQPEQPHGTDLFSLPLQQRMDAAVAVARFLFRQLGHLLAHLRIVVWSRFITVSRAIQQQELAGPAFAHFVLLAQERHILP
jgi:hypothetical protein